LRETDSIFADSSFFLLISHKKVSAGFSVSDKKRHRKTEFMIEKHIYAPAQSLVLTFSKHFHATIFHFWKDICGLAGAGAFSFLFGPGML